jgi:hypothetical protein
MSSSGMWRYVDPGLTDIPPKRRLIQDLPSATSQKTTFFTLMCLVFRTSDLDVKTL